MCPSIEVCWKHEDRDGWFCFLLFWVFFSPTREFLLFWLSIRNGADILSQFFLSLPWPPCKENKSDPTNPLFPFGWVLSGKAVSQSPCLNADLSRFPALMQFFPAYLWQVEKEAHQPPLDDLPAFLRKEAIIEAYPWGTKCLFSLQFHDAFLCSVFSTAWPDLWFFFPSGLFLLLFCIVLNLLEAIFDWVFFF